ncbi:hypothetical protein DDR33_02310 [Pararcticibacter amylolyticus]|uniref:Uncharacterized protein n=2 Tax=Pararcticibacter amylolyticus TaxID=2173175 RepID=A0A2U2PMT0_9SPHI|nr:hypothetical protein DDR33_02310 [Pararcticibacter amylolyticus]
MHESLQIPGNDILKIYMIKKILLNVTYNLAILLFIFFLIWSIRHERYLLSAASVFMIVVVVFLKVRLVKEVKTLAKKGSS